MLLILGSVLVVVALVSLPLLVSTALLLRFLGLVDSSVVALDSGTEERWLWFV